MLTENLENEDFTNQLNELETGLKGLEERNVLVYQVFQHKMKFGLAKDAECTAATNLYKKYDKKNSLLIQLKKIDVKKYTFFLLVLFLVILRYIPFTMLKLLPSCSSSQLA